MALSHALPVPYSRATGVCSLAECLPASPSSYHLNCKWINRIRTRLIAPLGSPWKVVLCPTPPPLACSHYTFRRPPPVAPVVVTQVLIPLCGVIGQYQSVGSADASRCNGTCLEQISGVLSILRPPMFTVLCISCVVVFVFGTAFRFGLLAGWLGRAGVLPRSWRRWMYDIKR